MRSTTILPFLPLLAFTATLPAQWGPTNPTTVPLQRRAAAMAWDSTANRLVMYGGLSSTPSQVLADTWTYNGQWALTAAAAPARWGHKMVSTATSGLLTFGGRSPTISSLANDTAQYVGGAWIPVVTADAPSPRFLYGMVYDTQRSVTVLFGGRDNVGANNETWEFDGVNWTEVTTTNAPAPREEFGMVFDRSLNRTVLFGGCDEANSLIFGDTWLYDGVSGTWTDATTAESPSPRFRGSMVYDLGRARSIFFGGFDGAQLLSDTYEYAGSGWVLIPPTANVPPNLTEAAHGYNEVGRDFVLFGGFGGSFTSETWEYTGANSGLFGLTGEGCPTAVGVPGLTANTPTIGTTLTLTIDNLGAAPGALVVLGLSNQDYLGNPIPFDLGLIGLPGCNLYQSADSINLTIATAGTATFGLPIPAQPALLNNSIYCQGIAIDVVPFLRFLGTTRGGRALIGN